MMKQNERTPRGRASIISCAAASQGRRIRLVLIVGVCERASVRAMDPDRTGAPAAYCHTPHHWPHVPKANHSVRAAQCLCSRTPSPAARTPSEQGPGGRTNAGQQWHAWSAALLSDFCFGTREGTRQAGAVCRQPACAPRGRPQPRRMAGRTAGQHRAGREHQARKRVGRGPVSGSASASASAWTGAAPATERGITATDPHLGIVFWGRNGAQRGYT